MVCPETTRVDQDAYLLAHLLDPNARATQALIARCENVNAGENENKKECDQHPALEASGIFAT